MTNTELIDYIIQQLEEEGFSWSTEKEIFEKLIFSVSDEDWLKKYKSKWSTWNWRRRGEYKGIENLSKSRSILEAIANNFNFKMDVWKESSRVQEKILDKAIDAYLNPKNQFILDIFEEEYIPPLTEEQEETIHKLQAESKENIEKKLLKYPLFFTKDLKNQNFLLKLLNLLYYKGNYEFLIEYIFPNLSLIFEEDESILIKKSHTLSSVNSINYGEIAQLLNKLSKKNPAQAMKLQTAALSNVIREYTYNKNISRDEFREVLLKYMETYYQLHQVKEPFNYYPAIKLAYILKILELTSLSKNPYTIEKIYEGVIPMIREHQLKNNDDVYYSSISELEFLLLLNRSNTHIKIELLLEELNPSRFLLERTLFQMQWFVEVLEKFELKNQEVMHQFQKVIEIITCYLEGK